MDRSFMVPMALTWTAPPGLYAFNHKTNLSKPLLNNYRGLRFTSPDDVVVDPNGDILFRDAPFAYVRTRRDLR